jgi:hypothetical protein
VAKNEYLDVLAHLSVDIGGPEPPRDRADPRGHVNVLVEESGPTQLVSADGVDRAVGPNRGDDRNVVMGEVHLRRLAPPCCVAERARAP